MYSKCVDVLVDFQTKMKLILLLKMGHYFSRVAQPFENVMINDCEYSNSDLDFPFTWHNHILLSLCINAWIILERSTTKYKSLVVFGNKIILLFSSNQSQCIDTPQVY